MGYFFMAIFRIEKTKNYTVMSNYHLKDKRLSFKAKGLLSYMLSLPDCWDFSLICSNSSFIVSLILKKCCFQYSFELNGFSVC